ncbi:MAG: alpha/beta hydrolase [Gammaproteobacteria bacterium]|nr:alpha/beta hydrolase [Gammaproteobacteria bacterium]
MNDSAPDRVEIQIGDSPEWSVIWLHGLGADGHDFEPVVAELGLPTSPAVRFVFPHAPYRAVTVNGGMRMRAWYDIRAVDIVTAPDADGIEASADHLAQLVEDEFARGIDPGKVIIAGFSQGGAIALHTMLTRSLPLAGVVALSTYLPVPSVLGTAGADRRPVPVFMGHGTMDPVVPLFLGAAAMDRLSEAGYEIEWHTYAIPHSVSPAEIDDLARWFAKVMNSGA